MGTYQKRRTKPVSVLLKEQELQKNYVLRADDFAKGVDAAEEVVPGIKKKYFQEKSRDLQRR